VNTLLYLSGEPGIGKSALMAELTKRWTRLPVNPGPNAPARDWLLSDGARLSSIVAVELGKRRDSFSGTDALPQTAILAAEAYLRSGQAAEETSLLLAEGARLANRRFLTAARDSGWRVILAHLVGARAASVRRSARADALGVPEQNPSWVKGRRTAAANLANDASSWGCTVIGLDAEDPPETLAAVLAPILGALV
jgi:hypothetical protein